MAQIAANLQRIKNGQRRYAITPRIPAGFIQPDQLQKYIDVANTFGAVLKLTGSQRIMITNLKAEDVDAAWAMLGMEPSYSTSNRVRSVKICPGTTFCKRAKQDSVHLGMQLERKYISQEMPSKMKMGVSGCLNSCAESAMKDIGVIGGVDGWDIYAGGSGGAHPRIGDLITHVETEKEVLAIVDRMVEYYKANAQIERMGEFIDRIGLETFKTAVLGDVAHNTVSPMGAVSSKEPTSVNHSVSAKPTEPTVEPIVTLPGQGNQSLVKVQRLSVGDSITKDSIIRDIVDTYPNVVPVLQSIGMGCLGCPSATAEPLWQAAEIHGVNIDDLIETLEATRKGA